MYGFKSEFSPTLSSPIAKVKVRLYGEGNEHKQLNLKAMKKNLSKKVIIMNTSQVGVLRHRMEQRNMSHGQTLLVDVPGVHIAKRSKAPGYQAYFCRVGALEIRKAINDGDGKQLPNKAIFKEMKFPTEIKPGFYNIKNVLLTSNGSIQLCATATTMWERTFIY